MFKILKWFSKKKNKKRRTGYTDKTLRQMKAEHKELKARLETLQKIEDKLKETIK